MRGGSGIRLYTHPPCRNVPRAGRTRALQVRALRLRSLRMIALRSMRGAGVVQRSFRFGQPGGSVCLADAPLGHSSVASIGGWTHASRYGGAAVAVYRNDDPRVPIPSFMTAVVLHGRRCLSSRSGVGGGTTGRRTAEKRQRTSAEAKDDAEKEKESYTFLEEEDLGRLSSESKGGLKTDTPPLKAAATEKAREEEPNSGNVTLWQRWKNARAKMKLLWKQYGLVWIGTYTVLYFGGLAGIYVVLDTNLVASDVDTSAAIQKLAGIIGAEDNASVSWLKHTIKTNPKANTLLKAVIVNELLEYPRDIVAIAATPSIARAIGRAPPKVKS